QRNATVDDAGGLVPLSWIDEDGNPASTTYVVPNGNRCVQCHNSGSVTTPIGPKVRNLNKSYSFWMTWGALRPSFATAGVKRQRLGGGIRPWPPDEAADIS